MAELYSNAKENIAKQSEAKELNAKLGRLINELRNTSALASNVADKIVGTRPEAVSTEEADKRVYSGFLDELRNNIAELESLPATINSHLNRIDQAF